MDDLGNWKQLDGTCSTCALICSLFEITIYLSLGTAWNNYSTAESNRLVDIGHEILKVVGLSFDYNANNLGVQAGEINKE